MVGLIFRLKRKGSADEDLRMSGASCCSKEVESFR